MTYEHQMYNLRWYANVCHFTIKMPVFYSLLCSANVCTKGHSDICCENSRTYLMVFSLIWGSIWLIDIQ